MSNNESIDFQLPMPLFIGKMLKKIPAEYGKKILKKICFDTKEKLEQVTDRELESGDCTIANKLFFEHASSILNKNNKYGIKNIRTWQNFDNFIITLINPTGKKNSVTFYCVPKAHIIDNPILKLTAQNSSKKINSANRYVPLATTFYEHEHAWLFEKHNLLKGTSYDDLLDYIAAQHKELTKFVPKKVETEKKPKRSKNVKIQFIYDNIIYDGASNVEAFVSLIKKIGAKKVSQALPPWVYTKDKTEKHKIHVSHGYHLNPNISAENLFRFMLNINKVLGINIKMRKKN